MKKIWMVGFLLIVLSAGFLFYSYRSVSIESIQLRSLNNAANAEVVDVQLSKDAPVIIEYWKDGSPDVYKTIQSPAQRHHEINLLLLEAGSTYHFRVIIDRMIRSSSRDMTFKTRAQSPWLVHNWVKQENKENAAALAGGMVMLCNARLPGYIIMVDGNGRIRWYWQINDIGVRAATLTPRGTILAMLRPPVADIIDDTPKQEADSLRKMDEPIRRGAIGFAGGTAIAEIDLTGKMLWRIDMDTVLDGKYKVIHHDVRMDADGNIVTLVRNKLPFNMSKIGGSGMDTLGGEGILVMNNKGKEVWSWNVWDRWDILKDPLIKEFAYDRFHANALNFDKDGNYLISMAIEDQIWKINATTGDIMWKLGKNGNFKMDTALYFSFQHDVQINPQGDLMIFDNSLWKHRSGAVSFKLDTVKWEATSKIEAFLPREKYTSRMGSAYLLPNGQLLQCSSKTGSVMVTDLNGKILWELNAYFVPYRAEYIPVETWDRYFIKK
ncbi:MAG: aryl-sulfate sulfotransferase [Niabella sp.]|nr:aryl-sulfate sulfotransferase [Niabella sp.]